MRYTVSYAHYDGNVYDRASSDDLGEARRQADALRATPHIRDRRIPLPVIITDNNDPERGDVSDALDD